MQKINAPHGETTFYQIPWVLPETNVSEFPKIDEETAKRIEDAFTKQQIQTNRLEKRVIQSEDLIRDLTKRVNKLSQQ